MLDFETLQRSLPHLIKNIIFMKDFNVYYYLYRKKYKIETMLIKSKYKYVDLDLQFISITKSVLFTYN